MRATGDAGLSCLMLARCTRLAGVLAFGLVAALGLRRARTAEAQEAGATLYVRTDTDHTTVITPRVHAGAKIDDTTRADFVYTADIWTSASVDIRASASQAITERRDEIHANLTHEWEDITLGGGYRL